MNIVKKYYTYYDLFLYRNHAQSYDYRDRPNWLRKGPAFGQIRKVEKFTKC